eukprot:scaffold114385_cov44-Prasinocladus_malaysianus.AAC.3
MTSCSCNDSLGDIAGLRRCRSARRMLRPVAVASRPTGCRGNKLVVRPSAGSFCPSLRYVHMHAQVVPAVLVADHHQAVAALLVCLDGAQPVRKDWDVADRGAQADDRAGQHGHHALPGGTGVRLSDGVHLVNNGKAQAGCPLAAGWVTGEKLDLQHGRDGHKNGSVIYI